MNERIKELEKETWQNVAELGQVRWSDWRDEFAKLIVRECMEQVWYTREDGINGNVSEVVKDRIEQHFGVDQ
jgi:hypothetical protein